MKKEEAGECGKEDGVGSSGKAGDKKGGSAGSQDVLTAQGEGGSNW